MKGAEVRRWATMIVAAGLVSSSFTRVAHAQQRVVAGMRESTPETVHDELLSRPVSVNLTRVPLKQALTAISTSAAVRIYYQVELVDAVTTPVTIRTVDEPLRAVLSRVLQGTHLQAVPAARGVVAIEPVVVTGAVQGALLGKVTNAKTKQPIAGATITVDGAASGTVTGEDGTFRITASVGTHTIVVRAVGFVKQVKQLTVTEGDATMIAIALDPSASVLDEVVVTGSVVATERKAIPTPITVVTADDIEKRGITRIDQLFRGEIPGIIAFDQGTNVYGGENGAMVRTRMLTRGNSRFDGGSNSLKTYVDGVELLDASALGTIDPRSIERIEIITGPQAATVYGSGALSGVMQIFTKRGHGSARPDVTLSLKYGILQNSLSEGLTPTHTDALSITGGTGPAFSYATTLTYDYTGQWQPKLFMRAVGGTVGVTHTTGPVTASATVASTLVRNGTFSLSSYGSYPLIRARIADGTWASRSDGVSSEILSTVSTQTMGVTVDFRLLPVWQHQVTVGRSQTEFRLASDRPTFGLPDDTLLYVRREPGQRTTLGYNTTFSSPRIGVLSSTWTLGATGSFGSQAYIMGCATATSDVGYVGCGQYTPLGAGQFENSRSWGGFGQMQIGLFDRLYLTAGLRGERNPSYGVNHKIDWTPSNGIAYTIERGDLTVKLLGSYGRATRPPAAAAGRAYSYIDPCCEPSVVPSQLANPNLRPEYSHGPQGGIEMYYGNIGSLSINHYDQRVSDLIMSVQVDSILIEEKTGAYSYYATQSQYQNAAIVRQYGWETTGSIALGALSLKGTYTWAESRILKFLGQDFWNTTVGTSFTNVPAHTGNITANYAHGGTSVTVRTNMMGQMLKRGSTGRYLLTYYERFNSRLGMYIDRRKEITLVEAVAGHTQSDVAISQRLTPWASFTMNVSNLTNKHTPEAYIMTPTLGRQTLFGLSLRYPTTR